MSKYKGLFTFDVENHRYLPVEQADGIIAEMDYHPEPAEPLIKDEKIRKAVRAWAEANRTNHVWVSVASDGINITQDEQYPPSTKYKQSITFECEVEFKSNYYTITELCGEEEAPEPIEPTFIDLDERIKEKDEE